MSSFPTSPHFNKYNTAENSTEGNAICTFSFSEDGVAFTQVGEPVAAKKVKWVVAKVGLFATRKGNTYETGFTDVYWFRIDK